MIKLLKRFDKYDWLSVIVIIGFIVCQVWLDLTMPDYTNKLTQMVADENNINNIHMSAVWSNGGMMMLCALGSLLCSFACGFVCARLAGRFARRLRNDLYNKVSSFSGTEMKKFSIPSLITRNTNDVVQIQMFVAIGLQVLIKAPILAIWAITKISNTSIPWTLATLITVGIMILFIAIIILLVLPKFRKVQKLIDNLNDVTRENISGVRVVRAFNAEQYQEDKFNKANTTLMKNQLFTAKTMGLLMPILTLCLNGLTLAIYWIGVILINDAVIPDRVVIIGNMTAFIQYALQVVMAFILLVAIFIILPRAMVSAKRINEVFATMPVVTSGDKINPNEIQGEIEFKDVAFRYSDGQNDVLNNISFNVHKGETIAIIGSTGCGKTTLINLIPRFYDVTSGEVLVDGMNVKDYKQEDLQNKIAIVSQKACLFKGDIKSNITYGCNEEVSDDDKRIQKALDISQATFVKELEHGIKSEVAQGGTNFSGGQKQRLSIARAVFKDAEIVVFDDSFSALDYKTDMLVRKGIKEKLKDKTIIIVAQRIGTIKNADKILVLDNGKIVGEGKHKELLKNCPIYKEIALSQLSKEEL